MAFIPLGVNCEGILAYGRVHYGDSSLTTNGSVLLGI